jgi:hypothetical protein
MKRKLREEQARLEVNVIENAVKFFTSELEAPHLQRRLACLENVKVLLDILPRPLFKDKVLSKLLDLLKILAELNAKVVDALFNALKEIIIEFPENIPELVELLISVTKIDNLALSRKGVEYLLILSADFQEEFVEERLVQLCVSLTKSSLFNTKVTGMLMIIEVYKLSNLHKFTLRSKFFDLAADESFLVRRAVAYNLPKLAEGLASEVMQSELFPVLHGLIQDEWENVRIEALVSIVAISQICNSSQKGHFIVKCYRAIAVDKSWRVRLRFVELIPDLTDHLGQELTEASIFDCFEALINDTYEEVQSACFMALCSAFTRVSSQKVEEAVFPLISSIMLSSEKSLVLRRKVANMIARMPSSLGRSHTFSLLVPLTYQLLHDPDEIIRCEVVVSLIAVGKSIGPQLMTKDLMGMLKEQLNAKYERLRLGVLESFTNLVILFDSFNYVNDFNEVYLTYLTDPAGCVRSYGLQNIRRIVDRFGEEWVHRTFVPKLSEVIAGDHKARYTALLSLKELSFDCELMQPLFKRLLLSDKVVYFHLEILEHIQANRTSCSQEQLEDMLLPLFEGSSGKVKKQARDLLGISEASLEPVVESPRLGRRLTLRHS